MGSTDMKSRSLRPLRAAVCLAMSATLLAACDDGKACCGPPPTPPEPPAPQPPVTPKEATVTFTVDSARGATVTTAVDSAATVTVTGADGTVYELRVPATAIPGPVTIEMRPFKSVTGDPIGNGSLLGVDIAPRSLLFAEDAELRITPAAGAVPTVGFAFGSDGTRFHLREMKLDGGVATLAVTGADEIGVGTWSTAGTKAAAAGFVPGGRAGLLHRVAMQSIGIAQDSATLDGAFLDYWTKDVLPLASITVAPSPSTGSVKRAPVLAQTTTQPCVTAWVMSYRYLEALRLRTRTALNARVASRGNGRDLEFRGAIRIMWESCATRQRDLCVNRNKLPFINEMKLEEAFLNYLSQFAQTSEFSAIASYVRDQQILCQYVRLEWKFKYFEGGPVQTLKQEATGVADSFDLDLFLKSVTNARGNTMVEVSTSTERYELGFNPRGTGPGANGTGWPFRVPMKFDVFELNDGRCTSEVNPSSIDGGIISYAETEWDVARDAGTGAMLDANPLSFTLGAAPGNDPATIIAKSGCSSPGIFNLFNTFSIVYVGSMATVTPSQMSPAGSRFLIYRKALTKPVGIFNDTIASYEAGATSGTRRGLVGGLYYFTEKLALRHVKLTP